MTIKEAAKRYVELKAICPQSADAFKVNVCIAKGKQWVSTFKSYVLVYGNVKVTR